MTYEEILEKIVSKLKHERELTRKGHKSKVTFDDHSFTKIRIREICKILLQLQDDEEILQIVEALQPEETLTTEQLIAPSDEDDYENVEIIAVVLNDNFDDWFKNFLLRQKSKPQNLEWINLLKIRDVCDDIDKQIQITRTSHISIDSFPYPYVGRYLELFPYDSIGTRKSYQQHRLEGSKYLQQEGIISELSYDNDDLLGYGNLEFEVDIVRFDKFYQQIKDEFEKRVASKNVKKLEKAHLDTDNKTKKENNEYVITYSQQRQIILNGNTQLGKPDFNSENDLVFSFLFAHPNERFTKEKIEKEVGSPLTKSLHKIVENLGFEGDTKRAFFSVSKDAIMFRNPVSRQELKEMRSPIVKTIRGGASIVLSD